MRHKSIARYDNYLLTTSVLRRYKWTILNCKRCKEHKGWCFEATNKKLQPAKFYGLTRPGLVLRCKDKSLSGHSAT